MNRRIFSCIICICMLASALPITSNAVTIYDVSVNGSRFTNAKLTVECGDGTAVLDTNTTPFTLTLTNAEITQAEGMFGCINSQIPLKIVLSGTNTVTDTSNYGIHLTSDSGGYTVEKAEAASVGKLTVTSTGSALSLWGNGNAIEIKSGEVEFFGASTSYGIYNNNGLCPVSISGGKLTAYGATSVSDNIEFSPNASVVAGEGSESFDIWDAKTSEDMSNFKYVNIRYLKTMSLTGQDPSPLTEGYTSGGTLTVNGAPDGASFIWYKGDTVDKENMIDGTNTSVLAIPTGLEAKTPHTFTVSVNAADYIMASFTFNVTVIGNSPHADELKLYFNADAVESAKIESDGTNLYLDIEPQNGYSVKNVFYIDESEEDLFASVKQVQKKDLKYVIPDTTATNVGILAAKTGESGASVILKKEDSSAIVVGSVDDSAPVVVTQLTNISKMPDMGFLTLDCQSSELSSDPKVIELSGSAVLLDESPSLEIDLSYIKSDFAPNYSEVDAQPELNKILATFNNTETAVKDIISVDKPSEKRLSLKIDKSLEAETQVSMPSLFFKNLVDNKIDINCNLAVEGLNVNINSAAISEVYTTDRDLVVKVSDFSPEAKEDLQLLSPESTVWGARYAKVTDDSERPIVLEDGDSSITVSVSEDSLSTPAVAKGTVIAAKGSGDKLVKEEVDVTKLHLRTHFVYRNGAWYYDGDPLSDNTIKKYYLVQDDGKITVGAIPSIKYQNCFDYYSTALDSTFGMWIFMASIQQDGQAQFVRFFPYIHVMDEYELNGKIYVVNDSYELIEKENNSDTYHTVSDKTTSPVGLISENWLSYADTEWYSDSENSFVITTPEQLAGVAAISREGETFSGKKITLANDINLCGKLWTPIENMNGTFYGKGNSILNLTSYGRYAGLFKNASNAVISDIHITGNAQGDSAAAGIVCFASNVIIYNIMSECNVISGDSAGSICASGDIISVENCMNSGSVTANYTDTSASSLCSGGIAGRISKGTIRNCLNVGEVTGGTHGAIIAEAMGIGTEMTNCYATKGSKLIGYTSATINDADSSMYDEALNKFETGTVYSPTGSDSEYAILNGNTMNNWVSVKNAQYPPDPYKYSAWNGVYPYLPTLSVVGKYNVTFPKSSAYEIMPFSAAPVLKNGSCSFRFVLDTDKFKATSAFAIMANGVKLMPENSIYTVNDITEDVNITVTGIVERPKTVISSGGGTTGTGGDITVFNVAFNSNGGSEIIPKKIIANANVSEPTIPVRDGFTFDGWFTDASLQTRYDFNTKVTKSITLFAGWKANNRTILLYIGKKEATVFGKEEANDVAPQIKNNRTMLPARFVAEKLGATVKWDGSTKKVTVCKGNIEIVVTIGETEAIVNGNTVILDSPAFIENNRTYMPISFIAEKLGATVEWNEAERKVTITARAE